MRGHDGRGALLGCGEKDLPKATHSHPGPVGSDLGPATTKTQTNGFENRLRLHNVAAA